MAVHTEPERETPSPADSVQRAARATPLTAEAKAHLRAAGSTADDRFNVMRAMIEAAIAPLSESNRHIGFDLTLSDEEVFRIVSAVEGALEYGYAQVVSPVYARLRGESPYVENGAAERGTDAEDTVEVDQ